MQKRIRACVWVLLSAFILFMALLFLPGRKVELPFKPEDVKAVSLYRFTVPASAQGMTVTGREDVAEIIKSVRRLRIKRDARETDDIMGGGALSFRFHMADGSEFILACTGGDGGGILTAPGRFSYLVGGNSLEGLWERMGYPVSEIPEKELPVIRE